jgi:transcriptional regulator with XRE-family HTH domain
MPRRKPETAEPTWTPNQVAAGNLVRLRQRRGLTQAEVARLLSSVACKEWTKAMVALTERSVTGNRVREFTADDLVTLARAFDVPVLSFLTPPPRGIFVHVPGSRIDPVQRRSLLSPPHPLRRGPGPGQIRNPAICRELESAGVNIAAVEILCGERGAAILDEHGRYHGLRGRIVRAVQRLGYDEETLARYDEGLRDGDLLLRVPSPPAQRYHVAALLQLHQVHQMGYFGREWFEQLPILVDPG